jgi:hypothetical protein
MGESTIAAGVREIGRLAGFETDSSPRGVLAVSREFAAALRGAGYGLESDGTSEPSALSGRKPLRELRTADGVLLVRRFSHGGLLRFLTGERFRDPLRPFREFAVATALSRAGIDTPGVAAARARPAPGWGWHLEIVTRRVEGAIDLDEFLQLAREGRVERRAIARAASATGRLVRALHEAGCAHADLTTKNMLVERSAALDTSSRSLPRIWILDLDRARIVPDLDRAVRWGSLARLYRYVLRREGSRGPAISRTDWARFLVAYEPDRSKRKACARAIRKDHARSLPWHALGWRLEKLFSPA